MNYPQQSAQGLASLGRYGDSMLMHVSPDEVSGLQALGQMTGHKLHTNPHTGLPEAFDFGDFFTSFLPTIVGAAVGGPGGAGIMSQMTPILAGAGTGALLAAAKGDDPLMGGLTGGLGGYGGSQLGQSFGKAFGSTGGTTAGAMDDIVAEGTKNLTGQGAGAQSAMGFSQAGQAPLGFQAPGQGGLSLQTAAPDAIKSVASAPVSPTAQAAQNLGDFGTGIKNLTGFGDMSIGDAYKQFTNVGGGSAADLAMPVGGALLAGLEPSDIYGKPFKPEEDKYDPYATLNLNNDTGLRLVAKGGYIDGYALGGAVNTNPSVGGGLSDLYNRPEGATAQNISQDGYGIGRLNSLANAEAMNNARTLGYADGGGVVAGERGMNMNELPTLNVNTGMQSNGGESGGVSDPFEGKTGLVYDMARLKDKAKPGSISYGYLSHLNNILQGKPSSFSTHASGVPYMAKGGYLNGAGDGMSDSIPATIEGKQPARLADGEFVVPADVVSHLGNGSSKAGSKRLYAMLDKVRHARTGNKKQGKEIKAEKYLPA